MNMRGIDVSHVNGPINWRQMSDVKFAFVKATQGTTFHDPMCTSNLNKAHAAGVYLGVYHFVDLAGCGEEQAQFVLDAVKAFPGMPVALDLEDDPSTPNIAAQIGKDGVRKIVEDFSSIIHDKTGKLPFIYGSPSWLNTYVGAGFGGHPLWIAEYGVDAPTLPDGWSKYTVWQFTDNYALRGIDGNIMHPDAVADMGGLLK